MTAQPKQQSIHIITDEMYFAAFIAYDKMLSIRLLFCASVSVTGAIASVPLINSADTKISVNTPPINPNIKL